MQLSASRAASQLTVGQRDMKNAKSRRKEAHCRTGAAAAAKVEERSGRRIPNGVRCSARRAMPFFAHLFSIASDKLIRRGHRMDLLARKAALRTEIAAAVRALRPELRAQWDREIVERVKSTWSAYFSPGAHVLMYAPLRDEIDISPLFSFALGRSATLILPRVSKSDGRLHCCSIADMSDGRFERSPYGIWEPSASNPVVEPSQLTMIIVPGRAFSLSGERLGRGKGYYDRFLRSTTAFRGAVAYDCQVVETVPSHSGDERIDWLITPTINQSVRRQ